MKFSIVIPCYNEEKNLELIVNKFKEISFGKNELELILVNNGSTDQSEEILNKIANKFSFVKLEHVKFNKGYGYGILQGLKRSTGEYVGWMHADMQTSPEEFIKCLKMVEQNNANDKLFIRGLRKNRPFLDRIFTRGMSIFETIYLKRRLYDINAQPTFFYRELYERFDDPPYDFSLDLYVYYQAIEKKYKIERFPVLQNERLYGVSSWNTGIKSRIKLIKRVLKYSKQLKNKLRS